MCTYNGEGYLQSQLASYLAQDHEAWDLWISDDGSTDATLQILKDFRDANSAGREIRVLSGLGRGSTQNFLSLLCHPELTPRYVALSDQDDIWHPEKLSRALDLIGAADPALYGAQSEHVDFRLHHLGWSRPPPRAAGFTNALTQNIVSGHSTVLTPGALFLVQRAGVKDVAHHDWWIYLLISGAGGKVFVDDAAVLAYRQHRSNVVGAHRGWRAKLSRIRSAFGKTYGFWISKNIAALRTSNALMTRENRELLDDIDQAPPGPVRAIAFYRLGLRRQDRLSTLAFLTAALLRRV